MKVGFIGLGRMGESMVLNLLDNGWKSGRNRVVAYNRSPAPVRKVMKKGALGAHSYDQLFSHLSSEKPKVIWIMITATYVDAILTDILPYLNKGDIVIDGGNSYFKDSQVRAKRLKKHGIHFLDVGTSGGVSGAREGACMMVGGERKVFLRVEQLFKAMCVKDGYGYMGTSGAGHFVKGIHNGIEYGMMGALAEGMNAIKRHEKTFGTDLDEVAKVYAHGSIIESRLTTWLGKGMKQPYFSKVSGKVPEGETEGEMKKLEKLAPMQILKAARLMRQKSRKGKGTFMGKLIAVMRNEFGGHKYNKR